MKSQDLILQFVAEVGKLVDARAKTTEAYLEAKLKTEIQAVRTELKITKVALQTDIGETRSDIHELHIGQEELRNEVKAVKTELKAGIQNLRSGVAKKLLEHEERIERVEKATKISSKH